jgi:hypothetical protein
MTTDGLFVATLLRDGRGAPEALPDQPRRGMSVAGVTGGGEPFGGQFFRSAADGEFYFCGPLSTTCREAAAITRIDGIKTIRRLPAQSLSFTPELRDKAVQAQIIAAAQKAQTRILAIGRNKQSAGDVPKLSAFDWSDRRSIDWNFDPRHAATASWSYDDQNLYLCVRDVVDETPMVNGGDDVQVLFKTGDAVEFELRTQADNDARQVIEGDVRLLLSVWQGQPVAVLYRYNAPGATARPVELSSPVGVTKIDRIDVLKSAKIAIDRAQRSYTVRAAIPLEDLGFRPRQGAGYRGDIGVVYSDKTGTGTELRMYWANPVNGMVNDLSIEAAITPANWGRFVIEE